MCGRYSLTCDPRRLRAYFELADSGGFSVPRYNIAPSQMVPAVVVVEGARRLDLFRWGLIPSWAKDEKIAYSTINARAETVDSKPAFRSAFRHRRCLIPADGFYEWQAVDGHKQPWRIVPQDDDGLFAFAGLWETWEGGGRSVHSCTIIVGEPNERVRAIHDRMPVILEPDSFDAWLDECATVPALRELLRPLPDSRLRQYRVSEHVNNPRNDDAACVSPLR